MAPVTVARMTSATPLPVTVRSERPDDQAAVAAVVGAAFGGARVPDLVTALRSSDAWLDLSFVAEADLGSGPEVVGHVAYSRSRLDAPARLVDVLVLSPLSVRPDVQRRGAGTALVHRSLAALDAAGRPEPLVFLEGSPSYYSALGFRPAGEWGVRRPSLRIPEAAFQVWPLAACAARLAAGEELTGTLVYHRVWWDHDSVGLRD